MATTNAKVSSAALTELQTNLTNLYTELDRLHDLMHADMSNIGAYWEDPKYEEFKENYSKQINKCGEISEKYYQWSTKVLNPTIARVVAIESSDVGSSIDGVVTSSGGGTTAAGSAVSSASSTEDSRFNKFNMSGSGNNSQAGNGSRYGKIIANEAIKSDADIECEKKLGRGARAVGADIQIEDIKSKNSEVNQFKANAGAGIDGLKPKISANMESARTAPTTSDTHSERVNYKCEVPKRS